MYTMLVFHSSLLAIRVVDARSVVRYICAVTTYYTAQEKYTGDL